MLGHLGVDVADLTIASGYNGGLMPLLGHGTFLASKDAVAFPPADGRRGAVRAVHDHVVAAGSVVLHPPRAWPHD